MLDFLPDSIIIWLLGGLLVLALFALSVTAKAWRESKKSPYYFLRIQAGKKMQRYLVASLVLTLLTVAASAYAWQTPEDAPPQVALLKHAKPSLEVVEAAQQPEPLLDVAPATVNIDLTPGSDQGENITVAELPALQEASENAEPASQPGGSNDAAQGDSGEGQLGSIAFSLDVSGNYEAINPSNQFETGFYTLYATFAYRGMVDGTNWSWSWQRNGSQIDGGNQVWNYGADGPGYIYFQPEEGFQPGEYALAIWVDDVLQNQASFSVTEGVAANN